MKMGETVPPSSVLIFELARKMSTGGIKRLMGHSGGSDMTEKVYTHKDIEELRKAIEMI